MSRGWRGVRTGLLVSALVVGCGGGSGGGGAPVEMGDIGQLLGGSRWWIRAVAENRLVALAVHWTDGDHSAWTQANRVPLVADRALGGGWTLRSTGSDGFCVLVRATGDRDAMDLSGCGSGLPTGHLGLLRRGPPLIREITLPPPGTSALPPFAAVYGFDPSGR